MENDKTKEELLNQIEALQLRVEQLQIQLHQQNQNREKDLEKRLAITIDHIPLAIVTSDRHGYITAANPAFLKVFDVNASDVIEKQNIRFFAPFVASGLDEKIEGLIAEKLHFDVELPFTAIGKDIFFRCRGISVHSEMSDSLTLILIIGDVSKRKLTEQELIKALVKAEESDKLKTAFLASMSHEIRTPMNHIIGFTEFLKDPSLPEDDREEYSKIVFDSSQLLLRLIEDIIDIAKIEAGQMKVNKTVFSVNDLLAGIHKSFGELRHKKAKAHIAFNYQLPPGSSACYIKTDATRLQQIFNNLLDNAFKFTDQGSVDMGFQPVKNGVRFFVKDSGIGIEPELQNEIFKRFRQLDYGSTKKYGGTGLGLTIVKGLLDLLEGELELQSLPGEGAVFTFTLPGLIVQPTQNVRSASENASITDDWSAYTIMVVEDERTNYNLLMIMLRPTKAKLLWARDGQEAIEMFGRFADEIDLVLMDIRLPIVNGYDATRAIKLKQYNVPVIAQTAYAMDVEIVQAMDAGCDDYITKPIDRVLLLEKIKNHLPLKD